ncbi:hypothetical protein ACK37A_18160 [Aeromonas veronii]
MQKATFGEVALWVMLGYPDHGVGADDPGLGMLVALFVRLLGFWVSNIKQDGVERTINAVNGIVIRVIGRSFSSVSSREKGLGNRMVLVPSWRC